MLSIYTSKYTCNANLNIKTPEYKVRKKCNMRTASASASHMQPNNSA